nr:P-loop NTPase fold protein [Pseudomonas otitidis]
MHSVFAAAGEIALALLESAYGELIEQIQDKTKNGKIRINDEQKQNILRLGKTVVRLTAAFAGIPLPMGEEGAERIQQRPSQAFKKLRTDLNEAIRSLMADGTNKLERIVIFVDDLDRIHPETAVEVLDVLKNVFDIEHCISVLAIDYDVVIKGLRKKFGEQEKNQREFRQYFDKIIQIPFSMPTSAYRNSIPAMLENLLEVILPRVADAQNREALIEDVSQVALLATDGVPRSIKRIVNTVSLLSIIDAATPSESEKASLSQEIPADLQFKILFTVVCLQVSFPDIHKALCQLPDLKRWDEDTGSTVWHLSALGDDDYLLDLEVNFTEDWEPTLLKLIAHHELIAKAIDIRDIVRELFVLSSQPGGLQALRRTLRSTSITDTDNESGRKADLHLSKDDVTGWCRSILQELLEACQDRGHYFGNLDRRKKAKDYGGDWSLGHDASEYGKRVHEIDITLQPGADPTDSRYSIDFRIPSAKSSPSLRGRILTNSSFSEVLDNEWFRIDIPDNPSNNLEPNLDGFKAETLPHVLKLLEALG